MWTTKRRLYAGCCMHRFGHLKTELLIVGL
jgi:hypothetical protein